MRRILLLPLLLAAGLHAQPSKTVLRWTFRPDETLAIEKATVQDILRNGRLVRRYEIRDEYLLTSDPRRNGRYPLTGTYRSFERNLGPSQDPWLLTSEIPLSFEISEDGFYTVPEGRIYPTIRHIPAFPKTPVGPGDSWTLPGSEVFPYTPPVEIPVVCHYTWLSNTRLADGREAAVIRFTYRFDHSVRSTGERPWRYLGLCDSVMLFDTEAGLPLSVSHLYDISVTYLDGTTVTYRGELNGRYTRHPRTTAAQHARIADHIAKAVPPRSGVSVRTSDEGVVIDLEEILFDFDSAVLRPEALRTVERIGQALRDSGRVEAVIVEGHTDSVGDPDYNLRLSERRARAVLDRLIAGGWVDPAKASYVGKGASEPVAPNTTEEGRRRNRRVEILVRHGGDTP